MKRYVCDMLYKGKVCRDGGAESPRKPGMMMRLDAHEGARMGKALSAIARVSPVIL